MERAAWNWDRDTSHSGLSSYLYGPDRDTHRTGTCQASCLQGASTLRVSILYIFSLPFECLSRSMQEQADQNLSAIGIHFYTLLGLYVNSDVIYKQG